MLIMYFYFFINVTLEGIFDLFNLFLINYKK